jgi:hypothetical protein
MGGFAAVQEDQKPDDAEILEALRQRHPAGCEFRVTSKIRGILGGEFAVVEISRNGSRIGENYYYSSTLLGKSSLFASVEEFVRWLKQSPPIPSESIKREPAAGGALSRIEPTAIIAIIITATICTLSLIEVFRDKPFMIPEILGNALTIILGFYFGAKVERLRASKAQPKKDDGEE